MKPVSARTRDGGTFPCVSPTFASPCTISSSSGRFFFARQCRQFNFVVSVFDRVYILSITWQLNGRRFMLFSHPFALIQVKVPAGVEAGNKLRVKGEGDAGAKGGPVGDLYVFLNVKGDPMFKRTGKDIYSERKVRPARRVRNLPCACCRAAGKREKFRERSRSKALFIGVGFRWSR